MINGVVEREPVLDSRVIRIKRHLESIDPTFVPLADRLARTPFKNLSDPEEVRRGEALKPTDLVAIHLTDTFPVNGIIRPKAAYEPDSLRFTTHLTANSVSEPINVTGHNWQERKYAILIPFQGMLGKVIQFHPNDTFLLDDFSLPEGAIILKDTSDRTEDPLAGKANILSVDYSVPGDRLNGFHRAVYQQIIDMGYFPQRSASYGWDGWGDDLSRSDSALRKFCEDYRIPLGTGRHESHWTGELEDLAYSLDYWKEINDVRAFQRSLERIEYFLDRPDIPPKYKQALVELYKRDGINFHIPVILPEFQIPDAQAEKAKAKIVDLTRPTGHYFHQPGFEVMPIVTREGIVSHDFARVGMGVYLGEPGNIQVRNEILGYKDALDHISVNSTGRRSVVEVINDPETAYTNAVMILISPELKEAGKIGRLPAYHRAEVMVKRRIPPRLFDGIIANESFLNMSAKDVARHILLEGMDVDRDGRRITTRASVGLTKQRFIEKYGDDLDRNLLERLEDSQSRLLDAYKAYAILGGYNEAEDVTGVDKNGVPNCFDYMNGAVLPYTIVRANVLSLWNDRDVRKKPSFVFGVDTSESLERLRQTIDKVEIPRINADQSGIMTRDQRVLLVENIFAGRKAVMEADQKIWDAYVESVSGKPLEQATSKDFLIGLGKKMGVPLYDTNGKVIWPD